ncbi:stage II sporulation protein E [Calidifontibacillus erzurumensis]|uniref:Stage II sporulation protein E n=1 Tax=Calidifontibacillus erzurumensis TaxID=2741433 RepID=A0A8J8GFB5_9BACI|nr:stage II sporulation protein E [Calidifontibacillus erzurumensis]
MQKIERELIFQAQPQGVMEGLFERIGAKIEHLFMKKGFLLVIVGFLLGRALILAKIAPFALPFFAAVFLMRKEKTGQAAIALVLGALSTSIPSAGFTFGSIGAFFIFHLIFSKISKNQLKMLPINVFVASLVTRLTLTYISMHEITYYDVMMSFIEAGLGYILTLIFIQSVPLLSTRRRKQALKNEEIICLIILFASVLTGTIGWSFYNISVEHVLSRYLVLLFAFVGGAAIGSTVGVVTGLILSLANVASLYQMSLLAFSGLLGGLLKDGKKYGVAIGLMIGTLLIGLYGEGTNELMPTIFESCLAMFMFFLTPQSFISRIAKFIPGTDEHAQEQQQYMRKIRDVTAKRVEQFSRLFQALSNSFNYHGLNGHEEDDQQKEIDYFLSNITEKTCQTCFRKSKCWEENFNTTYDYMVEIMHECENQPKKQSSSLQREWNNHCVKAAKVYEEIKQELSFYHANQRLKKQVKESRRLVADQLLGVSQVMEDFAKEIQRERENHQLQEDQIIEALAGMGIELGQIDIYSLKSGNVDIEISIPYCHGTGEAEKVIAPMLSDILGETIVVKKEECAPYPHGYCHVTLGSARAYVVETGVAHAAKGGALISGDCYSTIELGAGKYAIAISDGMGNGERAYLESNETLVLLQKILQSGIEEKVAIKSVNSVLSLRTTDEIFSTLDLAMIDLQDASVKFLKIGSSPSFIKRGEQIKKIEASNLPIGIIKDFEVDVVSEQLKSGDLLIMMSDGVFEGPSHVENYDVWMKRKLKEIQSEDPQAVADIILEEVIRTSGQIQDDMTVIVAKIKHNIPKWAAIPVYPSKKAQ